MKLQDTIFKIFKEYFNVKEQNEIPGVPLTIGQTVQYHGHVMKVSQILPSLPSNFAAVNAISPVKLPSDATKYPIYILTNPLDPTEVAYVSRLGVNNLAPIQSPLNKVVTSSAGTNLEV